MRVTEMITNFKLIDALLFWFSWYVLASFWPVLNQNISTFLCIFYKHSWAYFFSGGSLTTSGLGGSGLKNSQQDSFNCTPVQQLVGFYNKSHQLFMYPVRAFIGIVPSLRQNLTKNLSGRGCSLELTPNSCN